MSSPEIRKIQLKNFRGFTNFDIETNYDTIIISGSNGIGKTSVLEAIYLIGTSKSHRTSETLSLIKEGNDFAKIELTSRNKNLRMIIHKTGKTNFINETEIKKTSEFIGNIKTIMFSPFDLSIINGMKNERRNFIDLNISLYDKDYLRSITIYKKLLKKRNELLKEVSDSSDKLLKVITMELINEIKIIYKKRMEFIENLNKKSLALVKQIDDDINLKIAYYSTYDIDNIEKNFQMKLNYDLLTKNTNIGPHRDDLLITSDDKLCSDYSSQGQIRSIVIAMKLAIKDIIEEKTSIKPILLLDDVFAELDNNHQHNLLSLIEDHGQIFITTTSVLTIPDELLKNAYIINLDKIKKGV